MDAIRRAGKIVITTHLSPDGDALGSSLALFHFLKRTGKSVRMIVPNSFPHFLKWMNGTREIEIYEYNPPAAQKIIAHADLIFSMDYNISKRAGDMAPHLDNSPARKILIDHHLLPGRNFDITVSYPEISSTCELLFRLLFQAGKYDELTQTEAECLYCGMMTDTGNFTYNSRDPETFEIVSLLLRKKINKDAIYSQVFDNYSEDRFRLLGFTLSQRMEIYPEIHSALLFLSREDQSRFRFGKGDTEGFANCPLSIKGIFFSTFIREDEGLIKLSFRSRGSFPCNEFAAAFFNGGGHLNASGGEFYGTFDDAIRVFKNGLKSCEEKLKSLAGTRKL
ncbi:MAG: bifunctional oligoribonuclease/PAP phosphatase NrnA [Proteiniphilum sp.]|nr:bifunctional oligoribonuclease/PAP phosphatase NrnA [Proteiniphilum sp.]